MPPVSPTNIKDPLLRLSITVDGSALEDYYPVLSLEITHKINTISKADLGMVFSGPPTGNTSMQFSDNLKPGSTIQIKAIYGTDGDPTSVFKGLIEQKHIKLQNDGSYTLELSCSHLARAMTYGTNALQYVKKTDSDIIKAILGAYSGLTSTVTPTTYCNEIMTKAKDTSDWDFLLTRAQFNGMVVLLADDTVSVTAPRLSSPSILRVAFGESIESFNAVIDTEGQPKSITGMSKDPKSQTPVKAKANEPSLPDPLKSAIKAGAAKQVEDIQLWANPGMSRDELQTWATGRLLRTRMNAFRGTVSFIGNGLIKPGDMIELADISAIYNGNAYVSEVSHSIEEGKWTTKVGFGLEDKPVTRAQGFNPPAAGGRLPPIHGLQTAIVKKLSGDPDSLYRIQIALSSQSDDPQPFWAKLAQGYATNAAGAVFYPEVDDEVVVGFLDDDPTDAIVIGSLYGAVKACPAPVKDENNYLKSLTTKSGLTIGFDDENKILTIKTPGGNMVILDDKAAGITVKDQNNNSITMSSGGITLKSDKDILLQAKGNITLDATGKLNLSAKQDAALSGNNITHSAQMGFTAKGNSSAELSATGMTTIKGATVSIN